MACIACKAPTAQLALIDQIGQHTLILVQVLPDTCACMSYGGLQALERVFQALVRVAVHLVRRSRWRRTARVQALELPVHVLDVARPGLGLGDQPAGSCPGWLRRRLTTLDGGLAGLRASFHQGSAPRWSCLSLVVDLLQRADKVSVFCTEIRGSITTHCACTREGSGAQHGRDGGEDAFR